MQAGKDVYCEKPLTLTIDEGKLICKVVKKTGRVLQVGTQQRSEFGGRFLQAVAMVRDGRIGQLKRVIASTGGGQKGGPFPSSAAPAHLDWNMWLGQAPLVPYTPQRCHVNFRWWREYAGGQMTGRRQGVMLEGSKGRFFVNREGIYGKPVDRLKDEPLPEDAITEQ